MWLSTSQAHLVNNDQENVERRSGGSIGKVPEDSAQMVSITVEDHTVHQTPFIVGTEPS